MGSLRNSPHKDYGDKRGHKMIVVILYVTNRKEAWGNLTRSPLLIDLCSFYWQLSVVMISLVLGPDMGHNLSAGVICHLFQSLARWCKSVTRRLIVCSA